MRTIVVILAVLTVALLAVTGVVLFAPDPWKHQFSAAVSAVMNQKPAVAQAAPQTFQQLTTVKPAVVVVSRKPDAGTRTDRTPVRPVEAVLSFPTAPDPAVGASRATVLEQFGQPNTAVTLADTGRLLECFIYVQKAPHRTSVVMLVNGSVVSAQTISE